MVEPLYVMSREPRVLDDAERKQTVDRVVAMVIERGKLVHDLGELRKHEYCLPVATVSVLASTQEGVVPVIEIAENYGNPAFKPQNPPDKSFDGVRVMYRGSSNGLDEVVLQGFLAPDHEGRVPLPPAERLLRSKDYAHDPVVGLAREHLARFDAFLKYAQRELENQTLTPK